MFTNVIDSIRGILFKIEFVCKCQKNKNSDFPKRWRVKKIIFDTYVLSVLKYGCGILGYIKAENVERVHRKFYTRLLGVKNRTNNLAVYSELGRFPLYI